MHAVPVAVGDTSKFEELVIQCLNIQWWSKVCQVCSACVPNGPLITSLKTNVNSNHHIAWIGAGKIDRQVTWPDNITMGQVRTTYPFGSNDDRFIKNYNPIFRFQISKNFWRRTYTDDTNKVRSNFLRPKIFSFFLIKNDLSWVPELKIFPVNMNVIRQRPAMANFRWRARLAF